jgi:hypothetical protein
MWTVNVCCPLVVHTFIDSVPPHFSRVSYNILHRHIRSKEKDLALLSTIPAEQYVEFERMRRENGAKAIQRNWRTVQHHRAEGECERTCLRCSSIQISTVHEQVAGRTIVPAVTVFSLEFCALTRFACVCDDLTL